MTTVKYC